MRHFQPKLQTSDQCVPLILPYMRKIVVDTVHTSEISSDLDKYEDLKSLYLSLSQHNTVVTSLRICLISFQLSPHKRTKAFGEMEQIKRNENLNQCRL